MSMSTGNLKDNDETQNKISENITKDNSKEPQIKEEYIGINADKVTLFPYTVTIFVIMTIIFYFVALPLSIFSNSSSSSKSFFPFASILFSNLLFESVPKSIIYNFNIIERHWAIKIFKIYNLKMTFLALEKGQKGHFIYFVVIFSISNSEFGIQTNGRTALAQ